MLTNALEVSADAREAFFPEGFGKVNFLRRGALVGSHAAHGRGSQLSAPFGARRCFGPCRSKVALLAASDPEDKAVESFDGLDYNRTGEEDDIEAKRKDVKGAVDAAIEGRFLGGGSGIPRTSSNRSRSPPPRGIHNFEAAAPISDLARRARQPRRSRLRGEARDLAHGKVADAIGPGFRFFERGSLFSPYLHDVTDINILMFSNQYGGAVGARAAEAVIGLASSVFCRPLSIHLVARGNVKRKVSWTTFLQGERDKAGSQEAVVVSGIYHTRDGFLVRMNIAVSAGKGRVDADDRIEKIVRKVDGGDYATALQEMCSMVKGPLKSQISASINQQIGPLRFLVKQLEILEDHPDIVDVKRYTEDILGLALGSISVGAVHREAEKEMQRQAKRALVFYRIAVMQSLPNKRQRMAFLAALRKV